MLIGNQIEKAAQALLTGVDLREGHTAGCFVLLLFVCFTEFLIQLVEIQHLKITQP